MMRITAKRRRRREVDLDVRPADPKPLRPDVTRAGSTAPSTLDSW